MRWLFFLLLSSWLLADDTLVNSHASLIRRYLSENLPVAGLQIKDLKLSHQGFFDETSQSRLSQGLKDSLGFIEWSEATAPQWRELETVPLVGQMMSLLDVSADLVNESLSSVLTFFEPQDRQEVGDFLETLPLALRQPIGQLLVAIQEVLVLQKKVSWSQDAWRGLLILAQNPQETLSFKQEADIDAFLKGPALFWPQLLKVQVKVVQASQRLATALKEYRGTAYLNDFQKIYQTPVGPIVLGGNGVNIYQRRATAIIDFGGDDRYLGPMAAADYRNPVSLVFDVSGNDIYQAETASQGSGLGGVGLLWDLQGDDRYEALSLSQGVGFLGIGALVDEAGRDSYKADHLSQAYAAWGIGLLQDFQGDDLYRGKTYCQAFSRYQGVALLHDRQGDDFYVLQGRNREITQFEDQSLLMGQGASLGYYLFSLPGGLAFLQDFQGADFYLSNILGQGVGLWGGCGSLWDTQGQDHYSVQGSGLGAGMFQGAGYLIDWQGNDSYNLRSECGLGGARQQSIGALVDFEGDDRYQGESLCLGNSHDKSLGLLVDLAGRDTYVAPGTSLKNQISLGCFFDLGGKDLYLGQGGNDEVRVESRLRLHIDLKSQESSP